MNEKKNLAKKTTAILSAIAASSFLGLPVLAQNSTSTTRESQSSQAIQCVPSQVQSNRSTDQQSTTRSYSTSSNSSTTATPGTSSGSVDISPSGDASSAGAPVLPNQSDPRTTPEAQGQTTNPDGTPISNASSASADAPTKQPAATGQTSTSTDATTSSTSSDATTATSSSRSMETVQTNEINKNPLYNNVLGRGGSTAGANARMIVAQANNQSWISDRSDSPISYGSSQYQSNNTQPRSSGVTSGAQATNGIDNSGNTSTNSSRTNGQYSAERSSRSTDSVNQPTRDSGSASPSSSALQSSGNSRVNQGTIANCPPGMVPNNSMQNQTPGTTPNSAPTQPQSQQQSYPDSGTARQRANPNQFQAPRTDR